MKTEMRILDNGNYEEVVLPLQHYCDDGDSTCSQYSWEMENLIFEIKNEYSDEEFDSYRITVKYCPHCGYGAKK